ncbi:transglycosylase domain-containing protein, partial [Candidatus Daviesbacteria bacterium]|nr:transglycosylase domain-containing protein [Candidatus Daviesbacteria bacterium]
MSLKRLKPFHHNPYSRAKFLSKFSTLMLFSIFGGLVLLIGLVVFFATQVPSPQDLTSRNVAQATKIYDRDGELLYDIFKNQNRTPVKLADVPDVVKKATISIEDKDFYKHQGFSIIGIFRSIYEMAFHQRVEGGSTLTQQLVK